MNGQVKFAAEVARRAIEGLIDGAEGEFNFAKHKLTISTSIVRGKLNVKFDLSPAEDPVEVDVPASPTDEGNSG